MKQNTFNPMFNYIGGKRWLKTKLASDVKTLLQNNKTLDTYCEPFMGGMGAFASVYPVLKEYNIQKVILNDINQPVIQFYNLIKQDYQELFDYYKQLEKELSSVIPEQANQLHKTRDKQQIKFLLNQANDHFKQTRQLFNNKITRQEYDIEMAAALLFLQKHCFNGIYRENKKGFYNTPFNWEYKTIDFESIKNNLKNIHDTFNALNIELTCQSYKKLDYNHHTLYYCDPPYLNENKTENQYNKEGFSLTEQKMLIEQIAQVSFIYSNHDSSLLLDLFEQNIGWDYLIIDRVYRKNIISSSKESRKTDQAELLIKKL